MNIDSKQKLLHWAEVIDSLRIVPRLFLVACFLWVVNVNYILMLWYIHLVIAERTPEASAAVIAISGISMGFLKLVYTDYSSKSRDWNAQPSITTTASVTTSTQGSTS